MARRKCSSSIPLRSRQRIDLGVKELCRSRIAAQITAEETGRFVQVENYGSMPVQLNDLEPEIDR